MKSNITKGGRIERFWRREVRRRWLDHQWTVVGMLACLAFVLGIAGFSAYFSAIDASVSTTDIVYYTLQLFTLQMPDVSGGLPWSLEISRLLAPAVLVYTAAKALLEIFRDQMQLFRVRFIRNHVVVCGLGDKGDSFVRSFLGQGKRVVVVERDEENANIASCRDQGALVVIADAAEARTLTRIGIARADRLIAVCGDDSTNMAVAAQVRELAQNRSGSTLYCYAHIMNADLAEQLRGVEITGHYDTPLRIEIFNIFERGSRFLLSGCPVFPGSTEVKDYSGHLVVAGSTAFSSSLLVSAARLWFIAFAELGVELKITVIDEQADAEWQALASRYPKMKDMEHQLVASNVRSEEGQAIIESIASDRDTKMYVCICGEDDDQSLSDALELHQQLRERQTPVAVCLHRDTIALGLLRDVDVSGKEGNGLILFDLIDQTCTAEVLVGGTHETLARTIHADYVQEQLAAGNSPTTNPSICQWEDLPESLRDSNRRQADHISYKLKELGWSIAPLKEWGSALPSFDETEVETMARIEHDRWVAERQEDGWTYDPGEKDIERKTSPYLIPWEDEALTQEIKDLDRNTVRHLPLFLARAGFEIYKVDNP